MAVYNEVGQPGVYDIGQLGDFISTISDDNEQYHVMVILFNLTKLNDFVNDFAAAIALNDSMKQQMSISKYVKGPTNSLTEVQAYHTWKLWGDIAGRDATMTIYNYAHTLNGVRSGIKNSPTLLSISDAKKLRSAFQNLGKEFPNYELARNAVGHRGETYNTIDNIKTHGVNKGEYIEYYPGGIKDDAYIATFKGKEIRTELNENKRKKLSEITALVYSAFPSLFSKLPPMS